MVLLPTLQKYTQQSEKEQKQIQAVLKKIDHYLLV